jgi:hypothetical protein
MRLDHFHREREIVSKRLLLCYQPRDEHWSFPKKSGP